MNADSTPVSELGVVEDHVATAPPTTSPYLRYTFKVAAVGLVNATLSVAWVDEERVMPMLTA